MTRRNRCLCLTCNEIVESLHRHDHRQCSCGNVAVDGGTDYERVVYRGPFVRVSDDGSEEERQGDPKPELHETVPGYVDDGGEGWPYAD